MVGTTVSRQTMISRFFEGEKHKKSFFFVPTIYLG